METKFAICNCNFENSRFEYNIRDGETLLVTPEFEDSPEFKDGLRIGNFELIEIITIGELKKVIGVTDKIIREFEKRLKEVVEEPEEVPPPEEPAPKEDVPDESVDEPVDEVTDVVEEPKEDNEDDKPEEPVLAFTEDTKSWQAAVSLAKKETDVDKLAYAIRKDERVSVKKACVARLSELRKDKE